MNNKSIGKLRLLIIGCICSVLPAASSGQDYSIGTLSGYTGSGIASFGDLAGDNPGGTTFGQTFNTGGTDAFAQDISFLVQPYYPYTASAETEFQVFLMAWNGSQPVGPVLFASPALTTTGTIFSTEQFDVTLGNTYLNGGQEYVAFFTADNYLNGIRADAAMGSTGDLYSGGTFVAHYDDSNFNGLLSSAWSNPFGGEFELAFNMNLQAVPEPTTLALAGLGGLSLLLFRRQRKYAGLEPDVFAVQPNQRSDFK
jgi:PEP-CTERM motif